MVSTDLVLRGGTDVPESFNEQMKMAQAVSASGLLPVHLREKPANVLVILAGARALNISWFWATQSLYVVEGKLSYSAELMRALVIRAGHKFRILEHSDKAAKVEIVRSDDPDSPEQFEFNWDDAKKAGLIDKSVWKKFPKSMLLARATSMAVRGYCPDVLFGVVYTPEELGARVDESGEPLTTADGQIVIDSEVVSEVTVPQDVIDKIGDEIVNSPGRAAASTYFLAAKNGYEKLVPALSGIENTDDIRTLWLTRLVHEIGLADSKESVGEIWKLANGTKMLEIKSDDTVIGDWIKLRLEEIAKLGEASVVSSENESPLSGEVLIGEVMTES